MTNAGPSGKIIYRYFLSARTTLYCRLL